MIYFHDATDEKCPLPLVRLRRLLKNMQEGDNCIIQISDTGSKQDIPKLLKKYNYSYTESIIRDSVIELNILYRKIN